METGRGAWGCVVRNSHGEFLAARSGYFEHMAGPLHAEASAYVRAIEAVAELGIYLVIFESESSVLVNALNSDEYDRSTIGVLLRESRSIFFGNFESFAFSFCKRDCNKVAHELAVFGYEAGGVVSLWLDEPWTLYRLLSRAILLCGHSNGTSVSSVRKNIST